MIDGDVEVTSLGAKNSLTPGQRASSAEAHKDNLQAHVPLGFSGLDVWPRHFGAGPNQKLLYLF